MIRSFVIVGLVPSFLALLEFNFANPDEIAFYLGLGLFFAGATLLVAALRTFVKECEAGTDSSGEPRKLIVSGVYAYVRNPVEIAIVAMLLGETIFFKSAWILLWVSIYFSLKNAYLAVFEEPRMAKRFGGMYFDYSRNVGRWIPRKRPWVPDFD